LYYFIGLSYVYNISYTTSFGVRMSIHAIFLYR